MRRPLTFVHEVFKHDLYTLMLAADRRLNAGFVLLLQWSSRHAHYCTPCCFGILGNCVSHPCIAIPVVCV